MGSIMENLIINKFYETKDDVEKKLGVFFAFNVITQDEYTKLMQLAESKYVVVTDATKDSNTNNSAS
ncbi:hypothetical protein [Clostridium saccharoperbutylacetonicum]|uniref:hypothetical protein n=1 Tax=Clostridium saccharoperbutylacetonicum TaxID=36745 RepID=UPI000983D51C|nr:hypothetical protein [Clostridium saccharoperbutylacetonicum]AQR95579.1 hypothetical protein CLSAP_28950 [Clostridium saccharoperbutylacetonicum]NSB31439.1 hypothetical protein [Clostridium saccharoperbutylacetonicum]